MTRASSENFHRRHMNEQMLANAALKIDRLALGADALPLVQADPQLTTEPAAFVAAARRSASLSSNRPSVSGPRSRAFRNTPV